ncbi:MAG: LiaI-LiaF-like domain-containing protein [Dehalococcoidia bacterium]
MTEEKSYNRARVPVWGIVLVFLGIVLLLQNFGALPWGLWGTLWRFWPALLIIIGINIALGRYSPWLAGVLVVAVLGASLGLAIWQYESPPSAETTGTYSAAIEDLQEANVEVDFEAGRLELLALPSGSPQLVNAVSRGGELTANLGRHDGKGNLALAIGGNRPFWRGIEWEVKLSRDIPLTLDMDSDAADLDIDLTDLQVEEFTLDIDAGNCDLVMPSAGITYAVIDADAANVEITIPDNVAASINADMSAATLDISEERFPKEGGYYRTPSFEDSPNRVYLQIECNAGRVEIR